MNKRLLIVDDEESYVRSLALPLKMNYEILTANNYDTAIEVLKTGSVDIALVDIRLEDSDSNIDGLRILEWIKSNQKEISVFIMSAYREFSYAEQALNLGASHFFKKPIDIQDLIDILKEKG